MNDDLIGLAEMRAQEARDKRDPVINIGACKELYDKILLHCFHLTQNLQMGDALMSYPQASDLFHKLNLMQKDLDSLKYRLTNIEEFINKR